jgi:hypothetical protein
VYNPPIRGQQFIFYVGLTSQSSPLTLQSNPTLAAGDVKISKDGGAEANLNTLPAVTPAASTSVKVTVSATEMDADNITITFRDAAGSEWCDLKVNIQPTGLITYGSVNDGSPATTDFDSTLTGFGDDFFNGAFIVFTDGTLKGQSRKISDYTSTSGNIVLATATTTAPANGDPFIILGRSE